MPCTFTARTRQDLRDVFFRIALERPNAAAGMLDRIELHCNVHLAAFPLAGRARADLAEGIRQSVVGPYLIFYRPRSDDILIVRVIHGARLVAPEDLEER